MELSRENLELGRARGIIPEIWAGNPSSQMRRRKECSRRQWIRWKIVFLVFETGVARNEQLGISELSADPLHTVDVMPPQQPVHSLCPAGTEHLKTQSCVPRRPRCRRNPVSNRNETSSRPRVPWQIKTSFGFTCLFHVG